MITLAFDTTSEYGGAGVYRYGECLASAQNTSPSRYSVALFEMADRSLAEARLELRDVELFAVANGPGSFTGTRVGLAAAQAWGRAFERPVHGVSVLHAMAEEARPEAGIALPIMDARRGDVFVQVFRSRPSGAGHEGWAPAGDGRLLKATELREFIQQAAGDGDVSAIVREHDAVARQAIGALPATLERRVVPSFLVHAVARIGLREISEGLAPTPAELDAYYIRRSDAELNWKDQ